MHNIAAKYLTLKYERFTKYNNCLILSVSNVTMKNFTVHLNLCFEITSVYSIKTFPTFHLSCRNNNVIVTAFLISFLLSGDTYACFLLPINRYCLDTHDIISTFKFDYQTLKKTFHIRIFEGTLCTRVVRKVRGHPL